jgi:hypothetical protein
VAIAIPNKDKTEKEIKIYTSLERENYNKMLKSVRLLKTREQRKPAE